ncbi:Valine--tRNA ligase [Sphaceloma murrayae]|uniref:Valine--tRNA ligase n=1 Tax=Sphaceloma murrayae TaxID=2082308 RepID=A0A2K1QI54_9PEZI|nr:Valine--tRNA ligase [Sphaceloma murrayae]
MAPPPLQIAVLAEKVQFTDVAGADILSNLSASYVRDLASMLPTVAPLLAFAPEMTFHWPSSTLSPFITTANCSFTPTCTYDDCPRDIDVLIIGGPVLTSRPEGAARLMREVWDQGKASVLTTCVGSIWLADALGDRLKGKKMTTNRGFIPTARGMHGGAEWLDQRWVVDEGGRLWTAGGAGAGIDMFGAWVLGRFERALVELTVLDSLEVHPEAVGQFYKAPHPALEAERKAKEAAGK